MERTKRMVSLEMKLGTPRPIRRYSLVKLPVELLLLIGRQVRRTRDFKKLRLVCKLFNDIFAPIVLSHIHLRSYPAVTSPRGLSLRDLNRKNESLSFVKSLTVYSLEWLVFQPGGFHEQLHYLLLRSTRPFRYLLSAKNTPSLTNELASAQGKYYLEKLQKCILPNLESVKWDIRMHGRKTFRMLFLKFLVVLPSLKELNLHLEVNYIEGSDSFMSLLAQVSGLQKLTLRLGTGHRCYERYFPWFGRLIGNNPNLVYLHLQWWHSEDISISLLQALRHVPVDCPAQLQYLVLCTYLLTCEPDMIPHLRSLQSLTISKPAQPKFWETLALNGIFIRFLQVGSVDEALCEYLLFNTNLNSFTIATSIYSSDPRRVLGLFRALEATNVAQITISPFNLAGWYGSAEIEACLRGCTNLRRIKLYFFENSHLPADNDIRATIETVSRLGDKISLLIPGGDNIHRAVRKCCQSEDPLMKSLQQRLVFLRP